MYPLISVIVPVYNVEKYLCKCLDSIISQSYKNLEIILVDDGAQDNSGKICDEYAQKDSRITVLHTENGGLSAARNKGLDIITGEYVAFVDSDDYIACNMIEKLFETLTANNADISICNPIHVFDDQKAKFDTADKESVVYSPVEAIKEMWYQTSFLPSAWAKLFKADIFKDIRYTEGIIFEDIDIMHEVFIKADKIAYLPQGLYAYIHRENSITTQKFSEKDFYILDICDKIMKFAEKQGQGLEKSALAYGVTGNMRVYLSAPKEEKYRDIITQAESYITKNGKVVLKDSRLRKKARLGLRLYYFNKPLFRFVHSKINRWK